MVFIIQFLTFLSQSGNDYHYYAFKCGNENVVQKKIFVQMKIPLSQAQFCKIKYLPYFGCAKKLLQAYEVYHDIIMKTLLSFHSHFQKRLIIFSVSLVANFHFFLCQILFFQFSNFFFIDKTSSLSSKNILDSTFKLVVNICQIP